MQQIKRMGPLQNVLGMLPGMPKEVRNAEIDDKDLGRIEAIIRSMTVEERRKPELINGSRRMPDREGQRHHHHRDQQPAEAVQAGAADDEGHGRLDPQSQRHQEEGQGQGKVKGPKLPSGFPGGGRPGVLPAGFPGIDPDGGLPGFPPR